MNELSVYFMRMFSLQLFKMAMRQQKRIEKELRTKLKDEICVVRNGSGTVNGSTETTVALSQNETEVVKGRFPFDTDIIIVSMHCTGCPEWKYSQWLNIY